MRWGLLAAKGLLLAGIAWMAASDPGVGAAQLLPPRAAEELDALAALEARYAAAPTAENVVALASALLDHEQPGLASAAIDAAPRHVRELPEVVHLEARALFRRGRAADALVAAERVSAACAHGGCAPWLEAKAARQVAFLEQVVAAGVDDPREDPAAVRAAYERSTRAVRLVAVR